jgi:hypothetical protein
MIKEFFQALEQLIYQSHTLNNIYINTRPHTLISYAFGVDIDKNALRPILIKHCCPDNPGTYDPS